MKQPTPAYKPVSDALVEYQKARVAFVNTVNELLGKGDPGIDAAFLEGNLLPILYQPLVQGATLPPSYRKNHHKFRRLPPNPALSLSLSSIF